MRGFEVCSNDRVMGQKPTQTLNKSVSGGRRIEENVILYVIVQNLTGHCVSSTGGNVPVSIIGILKELLLTNHCILGVVFFYKSLFWLLFIGTKNCLI